VFPEPQLVDPIGHSSPKQALCHGIFADILRNPSVLSNQTECCPAAIVAMSIITNANNHPLQLNGKANLQKEN
jgi:hypothetical protein